MDSVFIHLGNDAIGIATASISAKILQSEIYVIDADEELNNDNQIYFWSNLKLKKEYIILTQEDGFFRNPPKVQLSKVIGYSNDSAITNLFRLRKSIHFSLSGTEEFLADRVESIYHWMLKFSEQDYNLPMIVYLINNYSKAEFFEVLRQKKLSFEFLDLKRIFFVECISDLLTNIRYEVQDNCIICVEPKLRLFANIKDTASLEDNAVVSFRKLFSNKIVQLFQKEAIQQKEILLFCTMFKYLLSIFVHDAAGLYISEYFKKHGEKAQFLSTAIIRELDAIYYEFFQPRDIFQLLVEYEGRLFRFGSDIQKILYYEDKSKLQEIYDLLDKNLTARVLTHNHRSENKMIAIPYALKHLDDMIKSN